MTGEPHIFRTVTVAVCTRNRARQLSNLLTSLAAMRRPEGADWELLLVDNGSSDDTRSVAESFADRLPIRYVREDVAGLSNARNRAVREAAGEYICWTDDDVEIDPEWLCAYVAAFRRSPDAAVFGGQILPRLEAPTPAWFARPADVLPISNITASRSLGDQPVALSFEGWMVPWGANYALRMTEQRRFAYDPGLGVSPNQRRLGEESEVIFGILNAGAVGWWTPDAKVHHLIPRSRQTRAYIAEYYAALGETTAYLQSTRRVHHLNRTGALRSPFHQNPILLTLAATLHGLVFAGWTILGQTRAALMHPSRSAFFRGKVAYLRGRKGTAGSSLSLETPNAGTAGTP